MRRVWYMLREMTGLIRARKLYFLAPTLIILVILALFVYHLGPAAVMTFIYAGL